jgi:hypothetical protein
MPDPWGAPVTSTGGASRDVVDDDASAEALEARAGRNLLLSRLLIGMAALLSLGFALVVGGGARAHAIDRDLFVSWWSHHAEYDCCYGHDDRCDDGVAALVEVRQRLRERDGGLRERVADAVAHAVGLADLDVSEAPADVAAVDAIFAACPALAAHRPER